MKRTVGISLLVAFAISAIAAPVTATQPPDHKVWVCHRTLSETNPFVIIPVDIAARDNGHLRPHNNAPLDLVYGPVIKGAPKPDASVVCPAVCG